MKKYKITLMDAGDSAVSIRFPQEISEKINKEVIFYLRKIQEAASSKKLPGILDIIPSYAAILVCFDPSVTDGETVKDYLKHIISSVESQDCDRGSANVVEIPVVYGGEYGPDLSDVATHTGLSEETVIKLHSETLYPVYMIGFLAGFPYLGGMNSLLTTPRLASPRLSVPAGSIGIADSQTGIYPVESPGGWRIIGRTPLKIYNPESETPFLISPGDYVKFIPSTEDVFQNKNKDLDLDLNSDSNGNETATATSTGTVISETDSDEPSFEILSSGPLTTIQDLGRHGYMDKGISLSGAMDSNALAHLNVMLGNKKNAAGLEATFITPKIKFLKDTLFAVSGIDSPIMARSDDVLDSFTMKRGIRTYFAFSGGIQAEYVLGSCSTDIKNRIGGLEGRKLSPGDRLSLLANALDENINNTEEFLLLSKIDIESLINKNAEPKDTLNPLPLYVTQGPQYSDISASSVETFLESEYSVSSASDRMGIRFDGPQLTFSNGKDGNIITDGLSPGAIQITPAGQPILMNVDAQTTGGYSKPFWLASVSKTKVAQLRPGDKVKFILISTAEAVRMWRSSIFSK